MLRTTFWTLSPHAPTKSILSLSQNNLLPHRELIHRSVMSTSSSVLSRVGGIHRGGGPSVWIVVLVLLLVLTARPTEGGQNLRHILADSSEEKNDNPSIYTGDLVDPESTQIVEDVANPALTSPINAAPSNLRRLAGEHFTVDDKTSDDEVEPGYWLVPIAALGLTCGGTSIKSRDGQYVCIKAGEALCQDNDGGPFGHWTFGIVEENDRSTVNLWTPRNEVAWTFCTDVTHVCIGEERDPRPDKFSNERPFLYFYNEKTHQTVGNLTCDGTDGFNGENLGKPTILKMVDNSDVGIYSSYNITALKFKKGQTPDPGDSNELFNITVGQDASGTLSFNENKCTWTDHCPEDITPAVPQVEQTISFIAFYDEELDKPSAGPVTKEAELKALEEKESLDATTPQPTQSPTASQTNNPSAAPLTDSPSSRPSTAPVTDSPSSRPSTTPVTDSPSSRPSAAPVTDSPSSRPSTAPVTDSPTQNPSAMPVTKPPTPSPTLKESSTPSSSPSHAPVTSDPTVSPTSVHSSDPSSSPTHQPVTPDPSTSPTITSSSSPSVTVSASPSITASSEPSVARSSGPSAQPSERPSSEPSSWPSSSPLPEEEAELKALEEEVARVEQAIPCIAVIDEDNDFSYSSPCGNQEQCWNEFRAQFPNRPFCLIGMTPNNLNVPANFMADPNAMWVPNSGVTTRLMGGSSRITGIIRDCPETPSFSGNYSCTGLNQDWLSLCGSNFNSTIDGSIPFLGLFVDDSGSLDVEEVQPSIDFLNNTLRAIGVSISQVTSPYENWISPFITTLVPP